jgi:hypothetical protein
MSKYLSKCNFIFVFIFLDDFFLQAFKEHDIKHVLTKLQNISSQPSTIDELAQTALGMLTDEIGPLACLKREIIPIKHVKTYNYKIKSEMCIWSILLTGVVNLIIGRAFKMWTMKQLINICICILVQVVYKLLLSNDI